MVARCYNEQDVLPEFLRRVAAVLDSLRSSSEIVLVDDSRSKGQPLFIRDIVGLNDGQPLAWMSSMAKGGQLIGHRAIGHSGQTMKEGAPQFR